MILNYMYCDGEGFAQVLQNANNLFECVITC